MKPFVINRNSWHYKLNKHFFQEYEHSMETWWEPRHNNFCAYWRATVFRVIFAGFIALFAFSFLSVVGSGVYQHPIEALMIAGSIIGVIALIVLVFFVLEKLKKRKYDNDKPESLLVQRYRAHKSKICPMVEYKK
jgi:heme/copper-type cytochrome/quinol oxidase subunit 2